MYNSFIVYFNYFNELKEYDLLFKTLIEQHAGKHLTDDEYFPTHAKLHIDRGAVMLKNRYNYSSNLEHFINQIINQDSNI